MAAIPHPQSRCKAKSKAWPRAGLLNLELQQKSWLFTHVHKVLLTCTSICKYISQSLN